METRIHDRVTAEAALAAMWSASDGPMDWRRRDCIRVASRAFATLWGVDPCPIPDWTSPRAAWRHVRRMGGPEEMARTYAARAGLVACDPHPGALGLLDLRSGGWPFAFALHIGPAWAVFAGNGVTMTRAPARVVRGMPCLH